MSFGDRIINFIGVGVLVLLIFGFPYFWASLNRTREFSEQVQQVAIAVVKNDLRDFSARFTSDNEMDVQSIKDFISARENNFRKWEVTAERGLPEGQVLHGVWLLFYNNPGNEEALAKAKEWWRKAEEQGNAEARRMLRIVENLCP